MDKENFHATHQSLQTEKDDTKQPIHDYIHQL